MEFRPDDRPRMSAADFASALDKLGMTVNDWSYCWGIPRRTVARWLSESDETPLDIPHWVPLAVDLIRALVALKRRYDTEHPDNVYTHGARIALRNATGQDHPPRSPQPHIVREITENDEDE